MHSRHDDHVFPAAVSDATTRFGAMIIFTDSTVSVATNAINPLTRDEDVATSALFLLQPMKSCFNPR